MPRNDWTKSGLVLPTLHPGNQESCFQENLVIQFTPSRIAIYACFIQHTYVINMYVTDRVFLCKQLTTLLISNIVNVKNIKDFIQLLVAFPYSNIYYWRCNKAHLFGADQGIPR